MLRKLPLGLRESAQTGLIGRLTTSNGLPGVSVRLDHSGAD